MVKFPDHSLDYMATIGTFHGGGWYLAKYGNSPKWGRQGSARFEPGFDLTALRFRELGVALGLSVKSVNFPGHGFNFFLKSFSFKGFRQLELKLNVVRLPARL